MIGAKISHQDEFGKLWKHIERQSQRGLEAQGEAVVKEMVAPMEQHGVKPSDEGYKTAPAGKPPYRHTGVFAGSITYVVEDGRVFAGPRHSQVGDRGAIFEFGGRELKPGEKGRPRMRKYFPHPFVGPAFDKQSDRFAPRIVGAMAG